VLTTGKKPDAGGGFRGTRRGAKFSRAFNEFLIIATPRLGAREIPIGPVQIYGRVRVASSDVATPDPRPERLDPRPSNADVAKFQ